MDSTFSKSQVLEFGKTSTGMFRHSFSTVWENKLLRGSIRESRGSEFELNDRAEDADRAQSELAIVQADIDQLTELIGRSPTPEGEVSSGVAAPAAGRSARSCSSESQ